MLYEDARKCLAKGDYVSRVAWAHEVGYLSDLPGLGDFLRTTLVPKSNVVPWRPDKADSSADDYYVISREEIMENAEKLLHPKE